MVFWALENKREISLPFNVSEREKTIWLLPFYTLHKLICFEQYSDTSN